MTSGALSASSLAETIQIAGDLRVRRLAFGAVRLTGPNLWGEPPDRQEAKRVLRRAIDLGVDLIDTADSYGPEVSERIIAEALHPYPPNLVIATKGGLVRYKPTDWIPKATSDHLKQACEASLKRLKLDRIDLYQLHLPDPDVPLESSIGALAELREQGKIRHVGLSNVTVEQLKLAQKIIPIVSVQNRYNIFDRASEDVLTACEREHLVFGAWQPLDGTGITEPRSMLARVASSHGATQAQVAIAWLLHRSPVVVPLPGTSSVKHLEENMLGGKLRLDSSEMQDLDAEQTNQGPGLTWHTRAEAEQ
ncbi:MAG TPA: aldo/keto reductase [Candidatus Binataceae bacterium]|nr:aldo/keto reductase [Candidatus Binataceae bacterium]